MENIRADLNELGSYSSKASGLSEHIGSIAGKHLADQHIGADMLGDLGEESGLHGRISAHIGSLHGATNTASSYVQSLGHAVSGAHGDYQSDAEAHKATFDKIRNEQLGQ